MSKVNILGVNIDSLDKNELNDLLNRFLQEKKAHLIATPNPEIILTSQQDPVFKNILNQADLAIPDGFGLMLASRYLKNAIKQRITGVDLMLKLCQMAQQKNQSIFLLGAMGQVGEKTAQRLIQKFPDLKIVGVENGFRFWDWRLPDHIIIEKINRAKPDLLFVAFGAPKQEKWLYRHLSSLPSVKIGMGVGGAFDYISGQVKRAPKFIRQLGLEWLFRLIRQPWRLARVINATGRFSYEVIKDKKIKHE